MFAVRSVGAAVALGSLVALAGCAPATPTSSPSAPPVSGPAQQYYCTPDGATSGAPCSQEEWEAQVARDKQYEEAEEIYRKLVDAQTELLIDGKPADQTVLQYAAGDAAEAIAEAHDQGLRYAAGKPVITWVKRYHGTPREGSTLAITACVDSSQVEIAQSGGETVPGRTAEEYVFFSPVDDELKVVFIGYKDVESCR